MTDLLQREHPQILTGIGVGGKIVDFRHLSRRISETVQDRVHVPIDHLYEYEYALSIGTRIDDLGWPLSEIQGHWFLKRRKNGEMQLNHTDAMYSGWGNKKLSYCWETARRESMPRVAEMDVEMTT